MSAQHTPVLSKLFDLPLGSQFRYVGRPDKTYVLLGYGDSGLIADAPSGVQHRTLQGLYSAADSRSEFEALQVEVVHSTGSAS